MALPNSIEQSADSRLKGANETAQVFRLLNAHGPEFTPAESDAYNKLRDAVMGISGESPETYMKLLAKYLDAAPNTQAPEVSPTPINDNVAPQSPVAAIEAAAAPVPEVSDIPTIPTPSFMSRDRSGAQFNVPEADPEPTPGQQEVPAEARIEVVPEVAKEEQTEVPKEEPIVEADLSALAAPGVTDVATVIQEKVAEVHIPADIEGAAKEIESINDTLNKSTGFQPLKLLKNSQTGYRDYMRKLILTRDAITEARSGTATPDLAALTEELRVLADGVRRAVEGKDTDPVAPAPIAEAAPTVSEEVAPVVVMPTVAETPVPLKVESAVPEVAAWSHQVPESPSAPVVENIAAAIEDTASAPQEASALNVHELPKVSVVPTAEQAVPAAVEVPQEVEVQSGSDLSALYEPGAAAAAEVMQEQAAAPQALEKPAPNPEIYSPKIQEELNELLTKWLGSDGWLIKKSGLEHPDWHKMAPLTVGEVMEAAQKGENHGGLQATMVSNLADNLRKWGQIYGISMLQHEDTTIDEMMHRIVFEFKKP